MVNPLLIVFDEVPFPLDPEPLFEWAKSDDETLARVALQALGSIESPQVRAFALEMIEEVQYASPAIKMLSTNYKPGDEERVIVALEMPTTPNFYHHTGMDARDFEEAHPSPLSEKILTLLYSDTPCSLCRERTVNRLLDLNALPIWIREEAIYDASEDTRKLVSGTEGEK